MRLDLALDVVGLAAISIGAALVAIPLGLAIGGLGCLLIARELEVK